MRWRDARQSRNVEDRGGLRSPIALGGMGGLGLVAIIVISMLLGVDPDAILDTPGVSPPPPAERSGGIGDAATGETRQFAGAVLGMTEDAWSAIFAEAGAQYTEPHLVLFSGEVSSACGFASAAAGPFYCPGDQKLYLDLAFFREMQTKLGASGDFAQAYVIAHEVGHHVQNLLGVMEKTRGAGAAKGASGVSVRTELQADCFAGIWANRVGERLEAGDIEEALNAASAVGDDTLQRKATGHVVPDSFTHGSSAQRARWFRRGFEAGKVSACNTFGAPEL